MSIDKGQKFTYKANYPLPGVTQSTQQLRDNFKIIKAAIEHLQSLKSAPDSVLDLITEHAENGEISISLKFGDHGFVLPGWSPDRPVTGSVIYDDGVKVYSGEAWDDLVATLPLASSDRSGVMSSTDKVKLDALKAGNATAEEDGYMSSLDKRRLDALNVIPSIGGAFSRIAAGAVEISAHGSESLTFNSSPGLTVNLARNPNTVTFALKIDDSVHGKRAGGLLHSLAEAGGQAGFISGEDKAKLDSIEAFAQTNRRSFGAFEVKNEDETILMDALSDASTLGLKPGAGIALSSNAARDELTIKVASNDSVHGYRSGGALHALAQADGAAGFMSGSDKAAIDMMLGSMTFSEESVSTYRAENAAITERYAADAPYETGAVVIYGGDEEVTIARMANDTRVAGVIAASPGLVLGAASKAALVATIGRVKCLVVGEVAKGDLLTTSDQPGRACRAVEPKIGSIIGKALEDHSGEAGLIEVAIQRF